MTTTVTSPNDIKNVIANAIQASSQSPVSAIELELAKLKAENEVLKAKAATKPAASTPAPQTKPAPIAPPTANADAKLLEILAKFKAAPRADGKVSGTLAVKVHGFLHACGVPEPKVREIIESAVQRKVISRMSIPTKKGTRMMLYFDARERPNYDTTLVAPEVKSSVAAAFGM